MNLRMISAALLATLAMALPVPAALADDGASDPSDPSAPQTSLPPDPTADEDSANDVTVGLQPATGAEPDERSTYEYEITPKGVIQDHVAVFNYSERRVQVTLTPRDATSTADTPFAVQENGEEAHDVGAWLAVSEKRLTLAPRSMTVVPFQLGVPYDARPGDHVGAIVLTVLSGGQSGGENVIVRNRVGLRVYLRVPGALTPELTIEDFDSDFGGRWERFGLGSTTIDYTLTNTGNVRLSGDQSLDLIRSFGLSTIGLDAASFDDMFPGGHIAVHQVSERHFAAGDLTTSLTVGLNSSDVEGTIAPVSAEATEFVLPWALILTILLAIALIVLVIRRLRRWLGRRPPKVDKPAHRRAPELSDDLAPALQRRVTSVALGGAGLGVVAAVVLAIAGTAQHADAAEPAPVWNAEVYPTQGTDDEPIEIRTSGGCPATAPNILGKVYGKGFGPSGVNVIGNTSAGVSVDGPFTTGLYADLRTFMFEQRNPVAFEGIYKLVVTCRTPELDASHGDYVVAIRFTDAHHWIAAEPVSETSGPASGIAADPAGEGAGSPAGSSDPSAPADPTAPPASGSTSSGPGGAATDPPGGVGGNDPVTGGAEASEAAPTDIPTQGDTSASGDSLASEPASRPASFWGLILLGAAVLVVTGWGLMRRPD